MLNAISATVHGGTPVPPTAEQSSPPLHPPVKHDSGDETMSPEKSQLVRPQKRPCHPSERVSVSDEPAAASQPVGWSGDVPLDVKYAGQIV